MPVFEVPLSPMAQTFAITLGGFALRVTVAWRNAGGSGWVMDLVSAATGLPLVQGVPLVTGHDLLEQHRHLGVPGGMFVMTDADPDAVPTYAGLGTVSRLYWASLP